jgi:hypothetical protein
VSAVTVLSPVEEGQFLFLFELASAAMDNRVPPDFLPQLSGRKFDIEVTAGQMERVTFNNHPVVRLVEAVNSQVVDAGPRLSAAGRIFHVYALLEKPLMRRWVRVSSSGAVVHPAVLRVAAFHAADTEHGFGSGFFEAVETTASGMDIDEPE